MDMGGGRQRAVRDGGGVGPGRLGDGPRLAVLLDALADGRAVRLAGAPDPTPSRGHPGLRLIQAARLGWRADSSRNLDRGASAIMQGHSMLCPYRIGCSIRNQEEAGSGWFGGGSLSGFRTDLIAMASSSLSPSIGSLAC